MRAVYKLWIRVLLHRLHIPSPIGLWSKVFHLLVIPIVWVTFYCAVLHDCDDITLERWWSKAQIISSVCFHIVVSVDLFYPWEGLLLRVVRRRIRRAMLKALRIIIDSFLIATFATCAIVAGFLVVKGECRRCLVFLLVISVCEYYHYPTLALRLGHIGHEDAHLVELTSVVIE